MAIFSTQNTKRQKNRTMEIEPHKAQLEALMRASDVVLKMAQGSLQPVCLKSHTDKDGSEVFLYAHVNGTFELRKSGDLFTIGGRTLDEHRRISMAANVALVHLFNMKDHLADLGKAEDFKDAESTMATMRKAFENSMAAMEIMTIHLKKARPAEIPEWDITGQAIRASQKRKIGKARHFHDMNADNEPTITPRAR